MRNDSKWIVRESLIVQVCSTSPHLTSSFLSLHLHNVEHFSPPMGPLPKPLPGLSTTAGPAGVSSPQSQIAPPPFPTPGPSTGSALPPMSDQPNSSFLDDLELHAMPPELKKEGPDWFAVFNPKIKRTLDISLVHTLMHATYVRCRCQQ